jgi:hypothetical protein
MRVSLSSDDTLTITGATTEPVTVANVSVANVYVAKTTTYTVAVTDGIIGCDSSGGPFTVTLPAASAVTGKLFTIADVQGSAATHNVTVARAGADTINGATSVVIEVAYSSVELRSTGSSWIARQ